MQTPLFSNKKEAFLEFNEVIDIFSQSLEELYNFEKYNNPEIKKNKTDLRDFKNLNSNNDLWIYFPWSKTILHSLNEEFFFKLRTARNKNIISKNEQEKFRDFKVGIAGLSVGSEIAHTIIRTGGAKKMRIADSDIIEVSNLNRMNASILDVNKKKIDIVAKNIWETDPFAKIDLYESGLNKDNLEEFLLGESKLDIFIDSIDDLNIKTLARRICKDNRIPVLMATDCGDSVILDIERYDLEPNYKIFHGIFETEEIFFTENIMQKDWLVLAERIIGVNHLPQRLVESINEVSISLPAVPQVGNSSRIAGAVTAFIVRSIANHQLISSGKYVLDVHKIFTDENNETKFN